MPWKARFHLTGTGAISSMGSVPGLPGLGCRLQIATVTVLKYGAQENVTLHGVWMQGCPGDQGSAGHLGPNYSGLSLTLGLAVA